MTARDNLIQMMNQVVVEDINKKSFGMILPSDKDTIDTFVQNMTNAMIAWLETLPKKGSGHDATFSQERVFEGDDDKKINDIYDKLGTILFNANAC